MEIEKKDYRLLQKIAEDEYLLIHPETNAGNVLIEAEGIEAKTVAEAFTELTEQINEKADVKDIPDVSNFITNAVSDLLNYYSKSDIDDTVSDLENKISAIPKFKISVVDALPTEDISDTTIYLVKTSTTESGNLFTEYIYVDSDWEKLGTQMLNLAGYATEDYVDAKVEDFITEDAVKDLITDALKNALDDLGLPYIVNEGDGAFYGPKIDFHLEDSIGRTWQCGTIQLDFQLPQRFDASYIGEDGKKHRPIMIHRVVFGSIERFIGILIEHFAGKFPLWLSPVQVKILTISDQYIDHAKAIELTLKKAGLRCEVDERAEKIGCKIRTAQLEKIPYMLVIGGKEVQTNSVSVRKRDAGDLGSMSIDRLLEILRGEGI